MRTTALPLSYEIGSKAWFAASTESIVCTTGCVAVPASRRNAASRDPFMTSQRRFPLRVQRFLDLAFHPGRETLVEPQIVPPVHGDEIAEPLVRHFVRDGGKHAPADPIADDSLASTSRTGSKYMIAPQFSIAVKNWLLPGTAIMSSLGNG